MNTADWYFTDDIIRTLAIKLDDPDTRVVSRGAVNKLLRHAVKLEAELRTQREANELLMRRLLSVTKEK